TLQISAIHIPIDSGILAPDKGVSNYFDPFASRIVMFDVLYRNCARLFQVIGDENNSHTPNTRL
ncbi:hypothetical protein ACWGTI_32250, partial [Mesorhizobium sp. ArgA1]